ncbi:HNH endonuclease [Salicibibacter kimchii]|uniref:HNH endonuclease n=2 Tax=Salicibibacter kimchii TaxID=2099786 RepID=A0A345C3L1_9BACI|nr:HNH endonuclease [Salicibibacter kimchii]
MDGYRFTRDEDTGYYRCNSIRKRLHQYVWEKENGKAAEGYHVHHGDENKSNNHIENLVLLSGSSHMSFHQSQLTDEEIELMRENLTHNARPKASEWHRSLAGREWHKKQYEKVKDRLHAKIPLTCELCGNDFTNIKRTRFCSKKCKAKWRREQGLDDVERTCLVCEKKFTINKYFKSKTCSKSCGNVIRAKTIKERASS